MVSRNTGINSFIFYFSQVLITMVSRISATGRQDTSYRYKIRNKIRTGTRERDVSL